MGEPNVNRPQQMSVWYYLLRDVLLDDGTLAQNLYDRLHTKQSYLRTISLIQLALNHSYIRYADEHFQVGDRLLIPELKLKEK